jgi:hypothetical protein
MNIQRISLVAADPLPSFQILAPQSIALRVQRGREHEANQTSGQIFTVPIAFKETGAETSFGELTTIQQSDDGMGKESKHHIHAINV